MDKLIKHLNSLSPPEQVELCTRCSTSIGYIRKAASIGQKISEALCINFERETAAAVRVESIRPDVDWKYIRGTKAA